MVFSISPPYKETLTAQEVEQKEPLMSESSLPSSSLPLFVRPRHRSTTSSTSEMGVADIPSRKPSPAMLELTNVSTMLRTVLSNQENIMSRLSQLESGMDRIQTVLYNDRERVPVKVPNPMPQLPVTGSFIPTSTRYVPHRFEDDMNDFRDSYRAPRGNQLTDSASMTSTSSQLPSEDVIKIRENAQLFSAIVLGLTAWIRDRVETRTERIFDAGLKERFNDFTKVISNIAKYASPPRKVPRILCDKDVVLRFSRSKDGTLKKVNGSSLKTFRNYQSQSDIFRSLCNFVVLLKMMPECLPPPGSDVISVIGEGLIDDEGNLLV